MRRIHRPAVLVRPHADAVVTDALFSFVKFGANFTGADGATTATDFSASARTITFSANAQLDTADSTFGAGSSLLLDGNGDYVDMPDSADWAVGLNVDFCWEFVVKPNGAFGSNTDLLSQAAGAAGYPIRVYRQSGANGGVGLIMFHSGGSTLLSIVGGSLVNSTWNHIAIVRHGTTVWIYVNGVQVNSALSVGNALFDSTGTMKIGAYNPPNATQWNGWIQCVRYTLGNARYPSGTTFTPPSSLFPTS